MIECAVAPPRRAPKTNTDVRSARATLSGWGRHPVAEMEAYRPERVDAVIASIRAGGSVLARGLGRSYGDAALNSDGAVILSERLDRFLDFDPATGVLACEAGVSFEDVLRHFVPRGFFPPVVPGTKFVTLGGALACDVHGKNHHHAGSIARHVLDFVLVTADGLPVRCSRASNADLFWATMGGMGLTGFITELRIRLQPIASAYVSVDYDRVRDLDEALRLFEESDDRYDYSVAWVDCLTGGPALGRSVLMRGSFLDRDALPTGAARDPYGGTMRRTGSVPLELPTGLVNRTTVRAFNASYYHLRPERARGVPVHFEPFFFPLDRVRHWNRLYGRSGFLQYQVALPHDGGRDGLRWVLEQLARAGVASFLAVLKRFGPAEPGAMLSFPLPGYTLALDLPYRPEVLPLLERLDAAVAERGGRVYLAKDARMSGATFARMYPRLACWREVRERIDPTHRFASDLSRRLGLER